jgi:hypothetical protein
VVREEDGNDLGRVGQLLLMLYKFYPSSLMRRVEHSHSVCVTALLANIILALKTSPEQILVSTSIGHLRIDY